MPENNELEILQINDYEAHCQEDGSAEICIPWIDEVSAWYRVADINPRRQTLTLYSDAIQVRLPDFHLPVDSIPDEIEIEERNSLDTIRLTTLRLQKVDT